MVQYGRGINPAIEDAIIGIVSKRIAPKIGLETELPDNEIIKAVIKLIIQGIIRIGIFSE